MTNQTLDFIGTGSSFNVNLGNNAAFIRRTDSIVFFDFGGEVFSKALKAGILDGIKNAYVFITHTHPDHCGSLGDFIFFCYFALHIKPVIITGDFKLFTILDALDVYPEYYTNQICVDMHAHVVDDSCLGMFKYTLHEVSHYKTIRSHGILIEIFGKTLYYSGDCNNIPNGVLKMLHDENIDEFYQDTCGLNYDGNPHMFYKILKEKIPPKLRSRIFCMHLDHAFSENYEDVAKAEGFNVVHSIFDTDKADN